MNLPLFLMSFVGSGANHLPKVGLKRMSCGLLVDEGREAQHFALILGRT